MASLWLEPPQSLAFLGVPGSGLLALNYSYASQSAAAAVYKVQSYWVHSWPHVDECWHSFFYLPSGSLRIRTTQKWMHCARLIKKHFHTHDLIWKADVISEKTTGLAIRLILACDFGQISQCLRVSPLFSVKQDLVSLFAETETKAQGQMTCLRSQSWLVMVLSTAQTFLSRF